MVLDKRGIIVAAQVCAAGLLWSALLSGAAGSKEAIWIEGEDYSTSSFNQHGWYQNTNITKELLSPGRPGVSNGEWHTHFTGGGSPAYATATYRFDVAEGGTYTWWIRLNPFRNSNGGANYSYRHQSWRGSWSPWKHLDVSEARDNMIDLVEPGIDIRFMAWCYGDTLHFIRGRHDLEIRLSHGEGDEQNHGGIDVMAFTNFTWAPTGVIPPDPNPPAPGPDDWFTLMIGPDMFSADSIIDMSRLIEKPAGSHGFVKQQGKDLACGDGTAIKFWGIDAGMTETVEAQERQARFYAKHGINMVRQHPVESALGRLRRSGGNWQFDADNLDKFDRWFSILKKNGIYMTWSIFYHHVVLPEEGIEPELYDELPESGAGKDTYGFATFIEEYQDSQWRYASLLLNHVNPYTGLAYKDDPALAIVETRNEDSVFFHNPLGDDFVRGLAYPNHGARLKLMWQQWVKSRYGNDIALARSWGTGLKTTTIYNGDGSVRSRPDSVNETKMYIYAAWEMEKDGPRWNKSKEKKRMGDFIRFLAEMQRETYETYQDRLRGLGYKAVTVSTAWRAGGPAASAANLWTDDAMGAIDRHNYFGGGAGGHGITAGSVNNDTHVNKAGRAILSSGLWQGEDKPFIMTEWTQKPPNQWKGELAPLMAFYGMGLQGWDSSYHFAGSRSYMGNGWPSMSSYVTETPHYIGQFPALAYAIYNGHFKEGDIVSARRLSRGEVFSGVDALQQEYGVVGYDENEVLAHGDTPVEALAIGRVTLKVKDGQEPSYLGDLSAWWDKSAQTVRSNTGELTWDYGKKVVMVHSARTQGVIGFAEGGTYELPGVTVADVQTRFVSLLFTPLDNRALKVSEHILITAMSQDKQYGTVYNGDGTELIETGGPPLLLEPVRARITLKGGPVTSVKVVDVYGVPTSKQVQRTGNTFTIDGRYATYYYEVKRLVDCKQVNVDGVDPVNVRDFAAVAGDWLLSGVGLLGDIDGDGDVGTWDLVQLARYWLGDCSEL
ncbi:MAG: hypothetical protein AMJ75_00895 [Phycisphaerae bacterium SM1_79]|nr:MAG: hypothetical protein AMJ75_00895 [Phycisphaerae bacterium SM1_79]